ncbi:MAG: NAD-dependent epimerase/dehydratase family protein [Candidatus Omnitrophica bacterium]|nr:NAD-dependent epimerase/dehydratase family protein [Candidatus Omnitrophota bacterium]
MSASKGNILVTGGAGFIGSHVAQELLNIGYTVVILDDLSGGFKDNIPPKAEFVHGSITDAPLLSELFKKHQFDYVFHLAAYAAEGLSHFIKRFNYTNNVIGSVNLINESVKNNVKCFVFTSSIAVYGENQTPMKEDLVPSPEDSYGIAKFAVELELKASHKMFGLNYIIFRPHNVYGENQNIGDKYRNVIGIFMNNIMQNKPLVIFGDGEQTRAFSYISDVAPLIAKSIESPACYGETFNVGADQPYTVNQLAQTVNKVMKSKTKIRHVEERNEVKHAYADHSKVKKFFNPQQSVPLEEGVSSMASWAKKVGARKSSEFEAIEIHKLLPPSWIKSPSH